MIIRLPSNECTYGRCVGWTISSLSLQMDALPYPSAPYPNINGEWCAPNDTYATLPDMQRRFMETVEFLCHTIFSALNECRRHYPQTLRKIPLAIQCSHRGQPGKIYALSLAEQALFPSQCYSTWVVLNPSPTPVSIQLDQLHPSKATIANTISIYQSQPLMMTL